MKVLAKAGARVLARNGAATWGAGATGSTGGNGPMTKGTGNKSVPGAGGEAVSGRADVSNVRCRHSEIPLDGVADERRWPPRSSMSGFSTPRPLGVACGATRPRRR